MCENDRASFFFASNSLMNKATHWTMTDKLNISVEIKLDDLFMWTFTEKKNSHLPRWNSAGTNTARMKVGKSYLSLAFFSQIDAYSFSDFVFAIK